MGSAVCRRWTQEEKDFVYDMWGNMSIGRISKRLDRTPLAIRRFAEKNNLGGCSVGNDSYLSTTLCSELIKVDTKTIIRWIKNKSLKARTNPLSTRRYYLIDPTDFKQFLIDNPTKWLVRDYDSQNSLNIDPVYLENKRKEETTKLSNRTKKDLWTFKEEQYLKELLTQGLTSREIANKLGRSFCSIRQKRLRIERSCNNENCNINMW